VFLSKNPHGTIIRLVDIHAAEQGSILIRLIDTHGADIENKSMITVERNRIRIRVEE
jgi:predicted nuclease of predicted toxin-antitoxin system